MIKIFSGKNLGLQASKKIKFSSSFLYKFGGIQKSDITYKQSLFSPFIKQFIGVQPAHKFKLTYSILLKSLNNRYQQKLRQILNPHLPSIGHPQNTIFINGDSPIQINFGKCWFGSRNYDQKHYFGFLLNPSTKKIVSIKEKMLPYEKNESNMKIQNWKFLGISQKYQHQTHFKVSMQVFFSSKMKLILNEKKQNVSQKTNKELDQVETHQLKMQIFGLIPIDDAAELLKFTKDMQKISTLIKDFLKRYKNDWRISQIDQCFQQQQNKKYFFGIF